VSFAVLGFYPGQDELVIEQSVSLSVEDLAPDGMEEQHRSYRRGFQAFSETNS
jgi:hypothetical protein